MLPSDTLPARFGYNPPCPCQPARVFYAQEIMLKFLRAFASRENLLALLLCLIIIATLIATADQAPEWIYQGF